MWRFFGLEANLLRVTLCATLEDGMIPQIKKEMKSGGT
jgi:hypothetical protein